ncbi:MAG TPA: hypothetical protein VH988_26525 [Thermoanaerobaculia bacterium]|jgi:hypothetical protein|nr:hypothetical protein [Thermoanaerobaculia bacterium]
MSSKRSIEEVLSNLETRAVFLRERQTFHAQQEVHHREQRAAFAAELEKVQQNLDAFRAAIASTADLAAPGSVPVAPDEAELPPPGRLMVGRLLRLVVESPGLEEPFGPTAVAAEANRRFPDRLREPVGSRAASDVLRWMLAEGVLERVRPGKASHEALYTRKPGGSG